MSANRTNGNRAASLFVVLLAGIWFFAFEYKSTVSVSLHGVDYSGREFSYYVIDPSDSSKTTGGEHINRYSAGGTTCCAELPKKWRPETQLKIRIERWLPPKTPGGDPYEITEIHTVDIPPYANGKPEALWVLRESEKKISVVSSDLQPDHPNWPGKIKGWPKPSLEYRMEIWEIYRSQEEHYVRLYQDFLKELEDSPSTKAREAWEFAKENDSKSISNFTGPDDPKYIRELRKRYKDGLLQSSLRLKQIMEAKP